MQVTRVGSTPLKGARHVAHDAVTLDAAGAVGDRHFCLVDSSRARVLRTAENPRLLAILARWDGSSLDLGLPSGETATGAPESTGELVEADYWGRQVSLAVMAGPHAELASAYLGFPVHLAAAPRGEVIYGSSISLVTTASVRRLAAHLGLVGEPLDPARFRATLVLDVGDEAFLEDHWAGRELDVGEARIRLAEPIPRCAVVDLDPATGRRDALVLKALGSLRPGPGPRRLAFGWDAVVTRPGVVRPGDRLRID